MSVILPRELLTAGQLTDLSYTLLAMLEIGQIAALHCHDNHSPTVADALARTLSFAQDLHAPLHDALEAHEYGKGGAE